jgi:hypothetical protein
MKSKNELDSIDDQHSNLFSSFSEDIIAISRCLRAPEVETKVSSPKSPINLSETQVTASNKVKKSVNKASFVSDKKHATSNTREFD